MQKSSLVDVWLVSKYTSAFRNSHRCSVEKAVLKNSAIFAGKHLCCSLFLTNLQAFFPVLSLNVEKKWKKKKKKNVAPSVLYGCGYLLLLWKVHRKVCTTIVLYLFNICTFKTKNKTFLIFKIGTKTPKPLFLIKHSLLEIKLKPANNDQIWLVVNWYRFFIRQPPFQDYHFWMAPKVVFLYRFDCMSKKYDRPPHQKSRFFITSKGVGFRRLTLKKSLNLLLQSICLLLGLLYKRNPLITTNADGSIFQKMFKIYNLRTKR